MKRQLSLLFAALALPLGAGAAAPATSLLNVSYDVSRGYYQDYNPAFAAHYQKTEGQKVTLNQSHGGSGRQARAVIEGLAADVVTMNSPLDIDIIARDSGFVAKDWSEAFPHQSAPSWSTTLFVVRKGNPKHIKDWSDLSRSGVEVIIPNPKVTGNGRYSYLAAWIAALQQPGGTQDTAKQFVRDVFKNVPVLDGGGRGATTTFAQRGIGDVLLTFESEVNLVLEEFGRDKFEIIVPSVSIRANNPVALVKAVNDRRNSGALAKAYLDHLYSDAAQDLYVKHHLRPSVPSAWERHKASFPDLKILDIEDALGATWLEIFEAHFRDGGHFDQIAEFE